MPEPARCFFRREAPHFCRLYDVVRGNIRCKDEAELAGVYASLAGDAVLRIVRTRNRFRSPNWNGYRDLLLTLAVKVGNVDHYCELQLEVAAVADAGRRLRSYEVYVYFREFFSHGGRRDGEHDKVRLLLAGSGGKIETIQAYVDRCLETFAAVWKPTAGLGGPDQT